MGGSEGISSGDSAIPPAKRERRFFGENDIPLEWKVGDIYLGLYEVTGILGQGGMGKVYRVHHRRWGTELAVKSLRPDLLSLPSAVEHFERECETWVNLGLHPHTVTCHYVRRLGGVPWIFAEYVEGGALFRWIHNGNLYQGGPEKALERILKVAVQTAWGLQHAHEQGLIHRDVKSGNVMMTQKGAAKVTDFGLASVKRKVTSGRETPTGSAEAGGMTPAYCSPEQALGKRVTLATDLWSWALCILESLIGDIVWENGPQAPEVLEKIIRTGLPNKRLPALPSVLLDVLQACLQETPGARPKTMLEAAAMVQKAYKQAFGTAYPHDYPQTIGSRAESLNNRSVSLLDLGKVREAQKQLEKALAISPQHPESSYNLEVLLWRTAQKTDDAIVRRLKDVAIHHPGQTLPQYLLARVHLERGDYESAVALLEPMKADTTTETVAGRVLEKVRARYGESWGLLRTVEGHADRITALRVSRNGRYVLTGSEDNTARLWEVETGQCVRTLEGHTGSVESVGLSAGGLYALSGAHDRTVRLWDVNLCQCIRVLERHEDVVRAVDISRDGRLAFSGSQDGEIIVWDAERGEALHVMRGHANRVNAVCASRDAEALVSAGDDGAVKLWRVRDGALIRGFEGHEGPVNAAWLSPCGGYLLSGGRDTIIRLWDTKTGACLRTFRGHTDQVKTTMLSRDGQYAVSGGRDCVVRLWQAGNGRCLRTFEGHAGSVNAVAITRDMRYLLSGSDDKTLKVWNLGALKRGFSAPLVLCRALESEAAMSSEAYFRDALARAKAALKAGNAAAAASHIRKARARPGFADNVAAMKVWQRLYTRLPRKALRGVWEGPTLRGHAAAVETVQIMPDGSRIVSGSADATIKVWDAATGACLHTLEGHAKTVSSVSTGADDRRILSGSHDGTLRVWNPDTGECLRVCDAAGGSIEAAALSPDGRLALSAGLSIKLWDVASERCLRTLEGHKADAVAVHWSPDGHWVLSGSSDETLKMWDIATGRCLLSVSAHTGIVKTVCVGLGGRVVLSGSSNIWGKAGELKLWNMETGECQGEFKGHTGSINSVWLSADSRFGLSGSSDGTARLWDLTSQECVRVFQGHQDQVRAVCMAADGRYLVTGSADGTVKTWLLDWDLDERARAMWDVGARPYIENFLALHTPYADALPLGDDPVTAEHVDRALTRAGRPVWTEQDFQRLLHTLGCAGYGWLEPEGVLQELRKPIRRSRSVLGFLTRRE